MNGGDLWTPLDSQNPWPGFLAFMEEDSSFFAGRDAEKEELFRLVQRDRLTVLFGRNGLGKTSLLHAGLFPRLREERFLPVYVRVDYDPSAPSPVAQVRNKLAEAAARDAIDAPRLPEDISLWEFFHLPESDFWNVDNELVTPVIVLDQFEEIFTAATRGTENKARAGQFLQEVADLVEGRPPEALKRRLDASLAGADLYTFAEHRYKVVISLREDYLADLESARWRMPSVMTNRFRLLPMNGETARQVAFRPPVVVDETVAEKIVRSVGRRAPFIDSSDADAKEGVLEELEVDPLLLSVFCRELNEKRKSLRLGSIGLDLLRTNADAILHQHYQRQMLGMPASIRRFVEWTLVLPGGLRDSVAWKVAEAELAKDAYLLETLVRRRLLTRDVRNQVDRVELTHDRLAAVIYDGRPKKAPPQAKPRSEARWRVIAVAALIILLVSAAIGREKAKEDLSNIKSKLDVAETEKAEALRLVDEAQAEKTKKVAYARDSLQTTLSEKQQCEEALTLCTRRSE